MRALPGREGGEGERECAYLLLLRLGRLALFWRPVLAALLGLKVEEQADEPV
jgi:hypothetical protein